MKINFFYKTRRRILSLHKLNSVVRQIIKVLFNKPIRTKLNLNFVFVDNKQIKQFNKKFLNKNFPTDILCFQYDKFSADIIVSLPQVIINAKLYGTTAVKELLLVLIHGLLHMKGMKDDTVEQRNKMLYTAEKVLSRLNIKS